MANVFLFMEDGKLPVMVLTEGWQDIGTLAEVLAEAVPEKSRAWATSENLGMSLVLVSGNEVRVSQWHFEPSKRRRENKSFPELLRAAAPDLLAAQERFEQAQAEERKRRKEEDERRRAEADKKIAEKRERYNFLVGLWNKAKWAELAQEFGVSAETWPELREALRPKQTYLGHRSSLGANMSDVRAGRADRSGEGGFSFDSYGVCDPKGSGFSIEVSRS